MEDARRLALLVARSAVSSSNRHALSALTALAAEVAAGARVELDLDAALFVAELTRDVVPKQGTDPRWASVTATCSDLAANRPSAPASADIARHIGAALAHLVADDVSSARTVIAALTRQDALERWGVRHLHPLISHLGTVGGVDPGLAAATATAAWRDPSCRREVIVVFPELLRAAPVEATTMWIAAVDAPEMYHYPSTVEFAVPPFPRIGSFFDFPGSSPNGLSELTRTWVSWLDDSAQSQFPKPTLESVVDLVVQNLRHADAWELVLHHAASAGSTELARLLLPALAVPNLFVMPTWLSAAHLARRLSPLLPAADHAVLEQAILAIDRVDGPNSSDTVLAALDTDRLQSAEARLRIVTATPIPPLADPAERFVIVEGLPGKVAADREPGEVSTERWLTVACRLLHDAGNDSAAPVDADLHRALRPGLNDEAPLGLPELLRPFLESPDPVHRMITTGVLPLLLPDDADVVAEVEHRLVHEPDARVLTVLLLLRWIPLRPHEVDRTMERIFERRPDLEPGAIQAHSSQWAGVAKIVCRCLMVLTVVHRARFSRSRVSSWFAEPAQHLDQVINGIIELRDVLNAKVTPQMRAEAFDLIETAAKACSAAKDDDSLTFEGTASGRVAAEIAASLFMCSGALDDIGPPESVVPRGNAELFANAVMPVLRVLADLPHPSVTRSVVQLCLFLAPRRGIESFDVIAGVLTAHDEEYIREAVPLDAVLEIVQRHVITDEESLRDEPRLSGLRRLLEVLADRGRGDTIAYADRMGEIFQ